MPDSKEMPFGLTMNFNTQDETTGKEPQEQHDKPFCIAIMGNFSDRQDGTEKTPISERSFIEIDRYNYDEVLASMALELSLSLDQDRDNDVNVALNSLTDFHPDKLYKNVAVFGQLRDLRDRLDNPETFKQAMHELGLGEDEAPSQTKSAETEEKPQQPTTEQLPQDASGGSLLDSIMDETEGRSGHNTDTSSQAKSRVDDLIRQIVTKGQRIASRDARQDEQVASIDKTITQQMRDLLHHPRFQALEAVWRGVNFMVKRIRGGKEVKLYLLDISRDELESDLAMDDVTGTQVYKKFCDKSVGDISWSLIVGDYRFGADINDMLTLSQLGIIAQQSGAQFIAAANENLLGCTSFSQTPNADNWLVEISPPVQEAWALLRKSPVAKNISLALPRFMLRAPYGKNSTTAKAFAFEEMTGRPEHEDYLWGNPAFLKAEQMARAFIESGWQMQFAKVLNTEDLPVHYYDEDGRTVVKPCAEISLTDAGASKMIAQGLIPLWSVKNSDRVHSGDFHSIVR